MKPEVSFELHQMRLNPYQANTIKEFMRVGGLCILPSDSSYILTGLLTIRGVGEDIDTLLDRHGLSMSLAFGNLKQVTDHMDLSNKAYSFIESLTPGGLTFVAHPQKAMMQKYSIKHLYADGTIGIRLTQSEVETQLANFFPFPSTPIRSSDGNEISSAQEALDIVMNRMSQIPIARRIALIVGEVEFPKRLSTVVREIKEEESYYIEIIREGAISSEIIRDVAIRCNYKGVIK